MKINEYKTECQYLFEKAVQLNPERTFKNDILDDIKRNDLSLVCRLFWFFSLLNFLIGFYLYIIFENHTQFSISILFSLVLILMMLRYINELRENNKNYINKLRIIIEDSEKQKNDSKNNTV